MTLFFSKMKFAYFSVNPFDIKKTIDAHIAAFKYFGVRPQMIVYDKDKTMVVSENLGEVIFVKKFEDFIKETGLTYIYVKVMIHQPKERLKRRLTTSSISF